MARPRIERRSPQESTLPSTESILLQVHLRLAGHVTRMEDVRMSKKTLLQRAPRKQARSWCSKKALQRPAEETACTGGNQPSVVAARGLRPRQLALISEKSQFVSSRQRGIKPQRKNAGGRKSEQHPYHPQPKSSSVQSTVGCVHQDSDSTATSKHARTDHQPSQKSSSAMNQPSIIIINCSTGFVFIQQVKCPLYMAISLGKNETQRH